jgi:hypothetical protein
MDMWLKRRKVSISSGVSRLRWVSKDLANAALKLKMRKSASDDASDFQTGYRNKIIGRWRSGFTYA